MKHLKKIPFFLFLLPLFFCLHGAVENFGIIRLNSFLKLSTYILIGIAILFFCINAFIKNNSKTAIVCLYISVWYLFFGAIQDFFSRVPNLFWLQKYSVLLPLFFFSTLFLIIFFKRNNFNLSKLFLFFNVLLSIYCIVDIFSLTNKNIYYKNLFTKKTISFNTGLVKKNNNIYFMLFDGYPGYKSLKDSFSFSNDSLYQFFSNNNFKILPTFSNYNFTYYSMSSMFNLNYIENNGFNSKVTLEDFNERSREIKNTKLFSIFEKMNYEVKNYSLFDLKNNQGLGYSFALNIGNELLITDKMLHSRFSKNVGWVFLNGKFAMPFLRDKNYKHGTNNYNKKVEQGLQTTFLKNTKKSQFVFLHFLLPHFPYYYDENARFDKDVSISDESAYADKTKFISYLKYTNNKIKEFVNQIIKYDSTATIICISDHGFREYLKGDGKLIPPVFDNICAVHFPDSNYLPLSEKFSNVNFFRYLFNSQFNQNFPYLKDTSFFLRIDSTIN